MFPRRRLGPFRPLRRIARAGLFTGLGFAAGRATARLAEPAPLTAGPAAPGAAGTQPTAADRLAELDRLKAAGLITDAEHAAKREEILRGL